jgi:hypothetical protein
MAINKCQEGSVTKLSGKKYTHQGKKKFLSGIIKWKMKGEQNNTDSGHEFNNTLSPDNKCKE